MSSNTLQAADMAPEGGSPPGRDMFDMYDMYDMYSSGPVAGANTIPIGVLEPPGTPLAMRPSMTFKRRNWEPGLYAQTVLAQFGASGWMDTIKSTPPNLDPDFVAGELDDLREGAKHRNQVMAEIVAQSQNASVYWSDLMMATPASHPYTWTLIAIGNTVAHMVAMHYKLHWKRPRPVELLPSLMPPLLTPPHPSYPNAHALESLVMSSCAALAAPHLTRWLSELAHRVGRNREIAGVHYPSDRDESERLAPQIMHILTTLPLFQETVSAAKLEWVDEGPAA